MIGDIMEEMKPHVAYLSVGSNLGSRRKNCMRGISAIEKNRECRLRRQSCFYKTEPVDYRDQRWFVNAAVEIETTCDPFELLSMLKTIEADSGRDFGEIRFGPRVLDLDIIFFDNRIVDTDDLVIPHPRMHLRRFVLRPLCDIAPKLIHPVLKKKITQLLETQENNNQRISELPCES